MTNSKEPVKVNVHVQPGARKNELLGFNEDVLRVKIAAPPVNGKANRELISFLSDALGIRKSDITIDKGETSKNKVIGIAGITKAQFLERAAARSTVKTPRLF
jgi:uncharacterized protein